MYIYLFIYLFIYFIYLFIVYNASLYQCYYNGLRE
jgi:hypothetical protein